eukprot:5194538-Alexandrium_andersonii.AAC.1
MERLKVELRSVPPRYTSGGRFFELPRGPGRNVDLGNLIPRQFDSQGDLPVRLLLLCLFGVEAGRPPSLRF